jgi:replicative DNA helicase
MLLGGAEALERIGGIVRPDSCYDPRAQILLAAGVQLQTRGAPVDLVTLENELQSSGKLERVGGLAGLSEFADKIPTLEHIEYHARIVRDRAQLRDLIRACSEIALRAYDLDGAADEQIQDAADKLEQCFSGELGGRSMREVVASLVKAAETRTALIAAGREHELEALGVATGLAQIDTSLTFGGLPLRQPTLLGADTSAGKSAFATTLMWNAARRGEPCLYCTLEDEAESPTLRIVSSLSGLDNAALQNLRVRPEEWERFERAAGELWNRRVHFFEQPCRVNELVGRVKRYVRRHHPRLIVVDYLQLLSPAERSRSRQEEIDDTFSRLVQMARSLEGAATLVVSQFHRTDRSQRPTKRDFYHSASIEQGAHTVLLLWDPPLSRDFRVRLGIIDKQKNGPAPVDVPLGWDGRSAMFGNASATEAEAYITALRQFVSKGSRRRERGESR